MEPLNGAARFAAFACYLNTKAIGPFSPKDAGRYARRTGSGSCGQQPEDITTL